MSSITLPMIGSIIRLQDGTYNIGPLPGFGGPFDTTTEYLEALAEATEFPNLELVREMCKSGQEGR